MPVILFHAGFPGMEGGFVGVDIFFVISGFLITQIIQAEIASGSFSIRSFYERRIRRILPALVLVSLCCLPFAFLLMFPAEFQSFGRSLVASQLFLSNILFWQESGYFSADAEFKPLLHTWSLSIEEQFYIVFPLFLLVMQRVGRRILAVVLATACLMSFGLSIWASTRFASANFYLLPTRAWELGVGGLIAICWHERSLVSHAAREIFSLAGLVAVLVAIFCLDKDTPFPGVWAALPVLGTASILLAARNDTTVGLILSFPLLVGIGQISYSAYLWHQPLLAFLRLGAIGEPEPAALAAAVVGSFGLALLSWRFVEVPFRSRTLVPAHTLFRLAILAIGGTIILGMICANVPNINRSLLSLKYPDFEKYDVYDPDDRSAFEALTAHYQRGKCFLTPDLQLYDNSCLNIDPQKPNFVLMGDSNAAHLWSALQERHTQVNIMQANATACLPLMDTAGAEHCTRLRDRTFARVYDDDRIAGVILSAVWTEESAAPLARTVQSLSAAGKEVIVLGPGIQYSQPVFRMLQKIGGSDSDNQAERIWKAVDISRFALSDLLQRVVEPAGGRFVSVITKICSFGSCPVYASNGDLYIFDRNHYTIGGARDVVKAIEVFPPLL